MKKMFLIIVICNLTLDASSFSVEEKNIVLLTAEAKKAKLIDNNEMKYPDAVAYPMKYLISFKDIIVEQGGSSSYPKKAKFEIETSSTHMMLKERTRVFLLVDITDVENHKLVDWGIVSSFICMNEILIDKDYEDSYFNLKINDESTNGKCTFVRNEHSLSSKEMFEE